MALLACSVQCRGDRPTPSVGSVRVTLVVGNRAPTRAPARLTPDDTLSIRAARADVLWVYRGDQRVLACPGAECRAGIDGIEVRFVPPSPGRYRVVAAAHATRLVTPGTLDADVLAVRAAGVAVDMISLDVHEGTGRKP